MDNNGLRGNVALITGAGRNLGRAIAIGLAKNGVKIGVNVCTNVKEGEETVNKIKEVGSKAIVLPGDISISESVKHMVSTLVKEFGTVDILISNAAIRPFCPLMDITVEEWDRVLAVNLRGPFLCAQSVIPYMISRGQGRIINLSGIDAYWGTPNRLHVVTSKAGILGFTRALASELVDYGITVNVIVPGIFETSRPERWYPHLSERQQNRMSKVLMKRSGQSQELSDVVCFLASSKSSYITGQEIHVNGGGWPTSRCTDLEHQTFYSGQKIRDDFSGFSLK